MIIFKQFMKKPWRKVRVQEDSLKKFCSELCGIWRYCYCIKKVIFLFFSTVLHWNAFKVLAFKNDLKQIKDSLVAWIISTVYMAFLAADCFHCNPMALLVNGGMDREGDSDWFYNISLSFQTVKGRFGYFMWFISQRQILFLYMQGYTFKVCGKLRCLFWCNIFLKCLCCHILHEAHGQCVWD